MTERAKDSIRKTMKLSGLCDVATSKDPICKISDWETEMDEALRGGKK